MNECLRNKYIFWIDLNTSPGKINCSLFHILLIVYDFHNYRIGHITFYSFILGVSLILCYPLKTMTSLSLMFPNPLLIWNLVSTHQIFVELNYVEIIRNNELQKRLTNVTDNYFQMTWIIFLYKNNFFKNLGLLVSKIMPGKFFCSASSLCGRKLNVSSSDSFITHSSADVLYNAFWEFFSIPFILLSSLPLQMFVTQGKTKHLNASNTVIIHSIDLHMEQTKTRKSST